MFNIVAPKLKVIGTCTAIGKNNKPHNCKIYHCDGESKNECADCDVIGFCNNKKRCAKCDVEWIDNKQKWKITWKQEISERISEKEKELIVLTKTKLLAKNNFEKIEEIKNEIIELKEQVNDLPPGY